MPRFMAASPLATGWTQYKAGNGVTPASAVDGAASPSLPAQTAGQLSMKKWLWIIGIIFIAVAAFGQTGNTFYASRFPGNTVGAKVQAAQKACLAGTALTCVIVIGPSLASYATGTMPTKCPSCIWEDYRAGSPYLPADGGTLTGGLTTHGLAPAGSGISDWHDKSGACKIYRGVVNVLDCGAVADGAWVAGGCGQTSPLGCWTGTDNQAAIGKAIAEVKANGGGEIYFPPSGTNIWMIGSETGCNADIVGSSPAQYALETLPSGITVKGAGEDTTTLMAEPDTGGTSTCWMFGNASQPAYDINFKDLRLDGNEDTDSAHSDPLHPNNNGQGAYQMGAIYVQPESSAATFYEDIRSLGLRNVQLTGFAGGKVPAGNVPSGFQSVLWLGTTMWDLLDHVSIYTNQYAAAIFTQAPDSLYQSVYMNNNSTWNPWPMVVALDTGTSRWTGDYWGGGGGANYVGLGVQNDVFANDINDYPGAGITAQCSSTVFGCGSNYIFAPSGDRASQGNEIIGGTSTDTASGYPSVLVAGTAAYPAINTLVSGVNFSSIGPLPTYLIQEQGAASQTSAIGNIASETPSGGDWEFLGPSSFALANQGATNTFSSGNMSDSASLLKYCGTAAFSASTQSSAIACSFVTSSSHCVATWDGIPSSGSNNPLTFTASAGSVTLQTGNASTGTASAYCSGD